MAPPPVAAPPPPNKKHKGKRKNQTSEQGEKTGEPPRPPAPAETPQPHPHQPPALQAHEGHTRPKRPRNQRKKRPPAGGPPGAKPTKKNTGPGSEKHTWKTSNAAHGTGGGQTGERAGGAPRTQTPKKKPRRKRKVDQPHRPEERHPPSPTKAHLHGGTPDPKTTENMQPAGNPMIRTGRDARTTRPTRGQTQTTKKTRPCTGKPMNRPAGMQSEPAEGNPCTGPPRGNP